MGYARPLYPNAASFAGFELRCSGRSMLYEYRKAGTFGAHPCSDEVQRSQFWGEWPLQIVHVNEPDANTPFYNTEN